MTNGNLNKNSFKESSKMAISGKAAAAPFGDFDYEVHSPTDSSEDSVEVKISPILVRNKRKCAEPRKVPETFTGPLKKRMCLKVKAESEAHPFRPWSPRPDGVAAASVHAGSVAPPPPPPQPLQPPPPPPQATFACKHEPYFRPPSPPLEQPVALVKRKPSPDDGEPSGAPRVPEHPPVALTTAEADHIIRTSGEAFPSLQTKREQRNYKNMTRERRIEANARERTRVHTISAAFDTLRRSIPSYSHNQKLSKLSVLRIACSYIMTLSSIVSDSDPTTAECVDLVTKTIQREGKLRKKKDDND